MGSGVRDCRRRAVQPGQAGDERGSGGGGDRQRRRGMKEIARQFAAYLWLLVKKWIFWLFAALDLAGAILVYGLYPQPELPRVVYWILPIIGLLWVNFQIYRDLAIPIDDRLRDVAETAAKDFEYWHFRKEKAAGISEQKLFSEWLIEKGVTKIS
jgi:hypothetical protein